MTEPKYLIRFGEIGSRSVEINPKVRIFANDTTVMIRKHAMQAWMEPGSLIVWDMGSPNELREDARLAIIRAAKEQGFKIHYYRPKAKQRGLGRRRRKDPGVLFIRGGH